MLRWARSLYASDWDNWVSAHLFRNQPYSGVAVVLSKALSLNAMQPVFYGHKEALISVNNMYHHDTVNFYISETLTFGGWISSSRFCCFILQSARKGCFLYPSLKPVILLASKGISSSGWQKKGDQPYPEHEELCPVTSTLGLVEQWRSRQLITN